MKPDDNGKLDAVIARRARLEQLASSRHKVCDTLQSRGSVPSRIPVDKATRLNAIKSDILLHECDPQPPSLHDLVDMYTVHAMPKLISPPPAPPAPPCNPPSVLRVLAQQPENDLLAQWRQQRARSSLHDSVQQVATRDAAVQATAVPQDTSTQTARLPSAEKHTSTAPEHAGPTLWQQWLSDAAMSTCVATFAAHVLLHMAGMRGARRPDAAVQVEDDLAISCSATSVSMDDDVAVLMHHTVEGGLFSPQEEPPPPPRPPSPQRCELLQPVQVVHYLWEQLAHVVHEPGMEHVLASCVREAFEQVAGVVPLA